MFYLLFASSSQLTIGSIDAMDFGAETCGLPPDFRPLRKAARAAALLPLREKVAIGGPWPPFFKWDADALHRLCEVRAG